MSVGYMSAILRGAGHQVTVLSPLSVGVQGYPRVTRPGPLGFLTQWAKYRAGTAKSSLIKALREQIVRRRGPTSDSARQRTLEATRQALSAQCDIVLVSAYTMYFETISDICALAAAQNTPVVLGGPFFNQEPIAQHWLEIDGLAGVFGGEPESHLLDLVDQLSRKDAAPAVPGFSTREKQAAPAKPLQALDDIPFPDYSDFPWDKYPNRIIPMMTGRGCGWGVCTFCSDVVTSAGREFRSRSLGNVLEEMTWQSKRHDTTLFTFLDLKLNSDLKVWRGLIEHAQDAVPGAQWTASIHAHATHDNGLGATDFKDARRAGLLRVTTGLESASQAMLNAMAKGTNPDVLSQTIRYAAEAGISVRLTLIAGYPGETASDVRATQDFLAAHFEYIDRVVVNRFALQIGTPAEQAALNSGRRMDGVEALRFEPASGAYEIRNRTFETPSHRHAMIGLLWGAHRINRKPLSDISTTFEGVM